MTINRNEFVLGLGAVAALTSCSSGVNTVAPVVPDLSRTSATALESRRSDHDPEDRLTDQLRAVYATPAALASRRLAGQMLVDPAFPALAKKILQTYASSLTGFQASILGAIGILTRDPGALNALVTGTKLSRAQRGSLESIGDALARNPAVRTVVRTAERLRDEKNTALLQQYVLQDITGGLNLGGPFATLGDASLDAFVKDVYALVNSTAFVSTAAAVTPIIRDPGFITFVRKSSPEIIATVIPGSVVMALMLPNDHDPPLVDYVTILLPALITLLLFGFALTEFLAAAIALFAVAEAALDVAVALGLFWRAIDLGFEAAHFVEHLYKTIDCDHDGDPSDPNDSSGNEC
jgi:hypothetical protein